MADRLELVDLLGGQEVAGDAASTPGWSRAAALARLPLHLIPLAGALALQRKTAAAPGRLVPA